MTTFVAEGLKLKVPVDIPIEPYIELLRDYRPQFTSLTKELLNGATQGGEFSVGTLMKTINNINRDIEKVSNTRRKMILESLVAFAHRNPALTLGAVIAAALGLSGHLLGCTASPTIGAAADIGKRFLKIEAGEKTRRLMRKVQRDLQPMIDNIVAPYVGTTPTVMHVISLRREIEKTVGEAASQRLTIDAQADARE